MQINYYPNDRKYSERLSLPIDSIYKSGKLDSINQNIAGTRNNVFAGFWLLIYRYCRNEAFPVLLLTDFQYHYFDLKLNAVNNFKYVQRQFDEHCSLGSDYLTIKQSDKLKKSPVIFAEHLTIETCLEIIPDAVMILLKKGEEYKLYYDTGLFQEHTTFHLKYNWALLRKNIEENPYVDIHTYQIVNFLEKEIILGFNSRKYRYAAEETIEQYYSNKIFEYGKANAIVTGTQNISHELFYKLCNYYSLLISKSEGQNVGIYFKSDISTAIGIFSILRAGKTIVTINPSYPLNRVKYIVDCLEIQLILTCGETYEAIQNAGIVKDTFLIDENIDIVDNKLPEAVNVPMNVPCYIIFTSGSTGEPKGVMISHKNIMTELLFVKDYFCFDKHTRALHILNYSFDFGLYDIIATLLFGGCLYCMDKRLKKNFYSYIDFINDNQINCINTTPSFFNILSSFGTKLPSLEYVHLGGEKVTYAMINKYKKVISHDCNLYNGYGPCECTIGSALYRITESEKNGNGQYLNSVPIGSPTDESFLFVLDEIDQLVPVNCIGELVIGGDSVGLGYVDTEKNIGKFVRLPQYSDKTLYKTGDLVRWLQGGNIEFIGRKDNQVKINGFRIELSEIDAVVSKYQGIIDCKTIYKSETNSVRNILICYLTCKEELMTDKLREFLEQYLPYYMVPNKFKVIKKFPLLASGKIDINALLKEG